MAKLSPAGSWEWAVAGGINSGEERGQAIAYDAQARRLLVAGTFNGATASFGSVSLPNSSTATNTDVFLAQLDLKGTWLGATSSQGPGSEYAQSITLDAQGNASIGGWFQGSSARFGGTTLAGNANTPTNFVTLRPTAAITSLSPSQAAPGQTVTLTGTGFVNVTAVTFNGTPAASFAVQSPTQLTAVVPAGATVGPLGVQNSRGTVLSATDFYPTLVTGTSRATEAGLRVWPNPVSAGQAVRVQLPAPSGVVRLELRNLLGQLAGAGQFSGASGSLPLRGVAPGFYELLVQPAGQAAQRHRLIVE